MAAILSLTAAFSVVLGCELVKKFSLHNAPDQAGYTPLSREAEARTFFSEGMQLMFDNKMPQAKAYFNKALELDPDSAYLHFKMAQANAVSADYPAATAEAESAIKLDPGWSEPYFFLIEMYLAGRKPDLAEPIAEKLVEIAPDDPLACRDLARVYEIRGLPASAIVVLEDYLDQHPDQIYLKKEYARLLIRTGRPEQAEKVYRQLSEDVPGDVEVWAEYAGLEVSLQKIPQALQAYQEELSLEPANIQDRMELVKILVKQGKPGEAIAQLETAKTTNPESADPWSFSAFLHLQQNQPDLAADEYRHLLELNPKAEEAIYNLGLIETIRKNLPAAGKWFSQIPSASKLYPDAQARMVWLDYDQGKKEEAIQQAQAQVQEHPGKKPFYQILAEIYQKEERYDDAIRLLSDGLKHIPEDPDLFYSLAVIYSLEGDPQKSLENAQAALSLSPDNPELLNFIGYSWADAKINLGQAEEYLKKALGKEPENGAVIDSMGWLYFQKGQTREALKWVLRANEKMPGDPEIKKHLGQIYLKLGDIKKAREYLQQALSQKPHSGLKTQIEDLLKQTNP